MGHEEGELPNPRAGDSGKGQGERCSKGRAHPAPHRQALPAFTYERQEPSSASASWGNYPKPLSTSVSSFGHPTIQLCCYFHSHDAHRKRKHLGAHISPRGPSLTRSRGSYQRDLSPWLPGLQAFRVLRSTPKVQQAVFHSSNAASRDSCSPCAGAVACMCQDPSWTQKATGYKQ